MRTTNENVFNNDATIEAHTKYILPDNDIYEQIAEFIISNVNCFDNILDVGCGKGDFSLPILKKLAERKTKFSYEGFDISEEMLNKFPKNDINNSHDQSKYKISTWPGDIAVEIPKLCNDKRQYDVIIISFVLHYFKDWKSLLDKVLQLLKIGGVLIQVSVFGIYSLLAGKKKEKKETPEEIVNFWIECFNIKEQLNFNNRWHDYIDTISLSDVKKHIDETKSSGVLFSKTASKIFSWNRHASFETLLEWIKVSPIASITGGLKDDEKAKLSDLMLNWLKRKGYNLDIAHKLPYYWDVFIYEKKDFKIDIFSFYDLDEYHNQIWSKLNESSSLSHSNSFFQEITQKILKITRNGINFKEWIEQNQHVHKNESKDDNNTFFDENKIEFFAFLLWDFFESSPKKWFPVFWLGENNDKEKELVSGRFNLNIRNGNDLTVNLFENIYNFQLELEKENQKRDTATERKAPLYLWELLHRKKRKMPILEITNGGIQNDANNHGFPITSINFSKTNGTYKHTEIIEQGKEIKNLELDEIFFDVNVDDFVEVFNLFFKNLNSSGGSTIYYYEIPILLDIASDSLNNNYFRTVGSFSFIKKDKRITDREFKFLIYLTYTVLKPVYSVPIIRQFFSAFHRSSLKSAVAAIMARNLSHNIGSHVITNTKSRIDGLALSQRKLQPDLSGLSKLLHYVQERQDFIAVLASGEDYIKGPVNLKEHIFDFLAYDGPPHRHASQEYSYTNYLLDNIIRSENITRKLNFEKNTIELELVLKTKKSFTSLRSLSKNDDASKALGSINLAIPYGMNGRQAFLTILENFIRNSAKHLQKNIPPEGLLISIIIEKKEEDKKTSDSCSEQIEEYPDISSEQYIITIKDNKRKFDEVVDNINNRKKIFEDVDTGKTKYRIISSASLPSLPIINTENKQAIDHEHKGIKEILICLAWMKGKYDYSIIENDPSSDLGFYAVRTEDDSFGISFSLECFERVVYLTPKGSESGIDKNAKVFDLDICALQSKNGDYVKRYILSLPPAEIYVVDATKLENEEKENIIKELREYLPRVASMAEKENTTIIKYFEEKLPGPFWKKFEENADSNKAYEQYKDDIKFAYYLNRSFDSSFSINSKPLLDYQIICIERSSFSLKNRGNQLEQFLHAESKISFISEESNLQEQLKSSEYVLFRVHYETFDRSGGFYEELPDKCCFLEGISGGNYTNTLIRNSEFTFAHYSKIIESCLTKICIIDERLFKKYLNPSNRKIDDLASGSVSLEGFKKFFYKHIREKEITKIDFEVICDIFILYANENNCKYIRSQDLPDSNVEGDFNKDLSYFRISSKAFNFFLKKYFTKEDNSKEDNFEKPRWGSYYKGKNIFIFNVFIKKKPQNDSNYDFEFCSIHQPAVAIEKDKFPDFDFEFCSIHQPAVAIEKDKFPDFDFLSIHYGLLEKLHYYSKSKDLIETLNILFPSYTGKIAVHSGRGDLHNFKKNSITFIPLSGIEWSLENSKFMLTELFYNQKYYPVISK